MSVVSGAVLRTDQFANAGAPANRTVPAQPAPQVTAAPAQTGRADQVKLASDTNPYAGFSDKSVTISVDRWKKGPNDSIEHILKGQGYSMNEIYRKDSNGQTLIERVAKANGLKDPNLLRPVGRELVVPVKGEQAPKPPATEPRPHVEQPKPKPHVAKPKPHVTQPKPPVAVEPKPPVVEPKPPVVEPKPPVAVEPKPPVAVEPKPPVVDPTDPHPPTTEPNPTVTTPPTAERKHHKFHFPWFHKKHKQPEAPTTPEVPTTPTTPTTPEVPVVVAPQPTTPVDANNAEVGMLVQGVQEKKFNRNEFQALNAVANQYTELTARYGKDGLDTDEMKQLTNVQQQYGQMFARFSADDKARVSFAGADNNADSRFRAGQNDQGGRLFDQFTADQISSEAFKSVLLQQREASSQLGTRQ